MRRSEPITVRHAGSLALVALLLPAGLASAQLAAPATRPPQPAKAPPAAAPAQAPATPPTSPAPASAPVVAPPALDGIDRDDLAEPQPILTLSSHFTRMRPASDPPLDNMQDRGLEQLGRLLYSKVTIEVEDQPLGVVLRALRRALGINLVAYTATNGVDGIDPDRMVNLRLEGASGREVLEVLASQAGIGITWQIHMGCVEFGPKPVLARPEARFTRVYEAGDLALQAPDFRPGEGGRSYNRRDSDEVLGELVRNISTHCEPEAFKPPPPTMVETPDGKLVPVQHTAPKPSTRSNGGNGVYRSARKNPNTTATFNFDPSEAAVFITGQWASIQTQDTSLTVLAPDFVHRAIDGYEQAIPPREELPGGSRRNDVERKPATAPTAPASGAPRTVTTTVGG